MCVREVGEMAKRKKKVVIMSIFTQFLIIEESFNISTISVRFIVEFFGCNLSY